MKKLAATIFFDSFVLMLLGLIVVMSASSTYSEIRFDSAFYLFNSHFVKVLLGISLMIVFCFIPYEIYREYSKPAIILITLILMYTLFFAHNIKGAGREINLGIISFRPTDAARLILIIHLAALIESKKQMIGDYKHGFLYLFIWVALISGLIFIQPNISNGILLVLISLSILYVGGAKITHLLSSLFFSLLVSGIVAMLFSHSRNRILTFINSIQNGGDINIQVKQALLGLGSGGIFGVGLGHSR